MFIARGWIQRGASLGCGYWAGGDSPEEATKALYNIARVKPRKKDQIQVDEVPNDNYIVDEFGRIVWCGEDEQ